MQHAEDHIEKPISIDSTSLCIARVGHLDDNLRRSLEKLPATGLAPDVQVLSLLDILSLAESPDEVVIADSTMYHPLGHAYPDVFDDDTEFKECVYVRITAPSYPVVYIVCRGAGIFIGDVAYQIQ